jgi:hypothetical protein
MSEGKKRFMAKRMERKLGRQKGLLVLENGYG